MHRIMDGISGKSIGQIVFEIMDPFNENKPLSEEGKREIRLAVEEKMLAGNRELSALCETLKDGFVPQTMAAYNINNMAEYWMAMFENIPKHIDLRMKKEAEARKRKSKRKEPCLYTFIQDFRGGKREEKYKDLMKTPLAMTFYTMGRRNTRNEPQYMFHRAKMIYKVIFKTARDIYEEEGKIVKERRTGDRMNGAEERTRIYKESRVEDVFGMKISPMKIESVSRMVEFLTRNYKVIEDENYYKKPKKDKPEYRSRHLKILTPESNNDFVEIHILGVNDLINNDCWELSHPNKDAMESYMARKNPRFKELHAKAEFLVPKPAL